MSDIKLVVMAGQWTNWLDAYRAVSPRIQAVAAETPEALTKEIVDAEVVFGRLPREPFLAAKNLKWVQSIGVGFETMLYDEMIASDVVITNTAGAFDSAMAEHALALILAHTRGIIAAERHRASRTYTREIPLSQIDGKVACVLGLGTIGRNCAKRLGGLGMTITAVDAQVTSPPAGVSTVYAPDRLHEALSGADVVVVALPLTRNTEGIINAACFDAMKESAFLVNVARGPIVNESDLIAALGAGTIAGAGLDVFEEEPLPHDSPLWDLPNAIITPHIGGRSAEGLDNSKAIFCDNLARYVAGEPLRNVVDKKKGYVIQ